MATNVNSFSCLECEKSFTDRKNLARHVRQVHQQLKQLCPKCGKGYSRKERLLQHLETCGQFNCKKCDASFTDFMAFNEHKMTEHPQKRKRGVTAKPTNEKNSAPLPKIPKTSQYIITDPEPPTEEMLPQDPEVARIFTENWAAIRTRTHLSKGVQDLYNYRLSTTSLDGLQEQLMKDILHQQQQTFKIDVAYGFILRNNDTSQLRYFHSSHCNGGVLQEPFLVVNQHSFDEFLDIINNSDILEWARLQRPTSKWVVEMVTNVTFFVNKILDFPIGAAVNLPPYILNNAGIIALQKDEHHNFFYNDNLCFFRCLSLFHGENTHSLNKSTDYFFRQYVGTNADKNAFQGVTIENLLSIEEKFRINVNVYSVMPKEDKTKSNDGDDDDDAMDVDNEDVEDDHNLIAITVRRSVGKFERTMHLNLFENHFSYIKDFSVYAKRFICSKCKKLWKSRRLVARHEATCTGTVRLQYPGGVFHLQPTVFEELEEEGIFVENNLRFHPYRATFDLEAYFDRSTLPPSSNKQVWKARHVPLSVSICSNVPNYTDPTCIITEGDSLQLIKKMIAQLEAISTASFEKLMSAYSDIFIKIDEAISAARKKEPSTKGDKKEKRLKLETIRDRLHGWIQELPVLGFNSGSYDLNLIKPFLIQSLEMSEGFTIKKCNNIMCLKTKCLKFLDICNYLAAGVSYDKFLKAYKCSLEKGFFPYEFIDSLDKLNIPFLPSHDDFYSNLKCCNISKEEYKTCQDVWSQEQMKTFRDYLIFYNNRDVQPFLAAIDKMFNFYREKSIDMFKDGISVPGLTMRFLFQTLSKESYFTLFNEKNSDLHTVLKENIVGGPSIIFNRFQEVGETFIRKQDYEEESKKCQSVLGFDANALYLDCLMKDMPTGWYVRRRSPDFKAQESFRYGRMAMEWLELKAHQDDIHIRHQFNGRERRIGARGLPVDGWCSSTNTVYQFHGCYWHGHDCHLNTGKLENQTRGKSMKELREDTDKNTKYIKSLGFEVIEMWECEWRALSKTPSVKEFLKSFNKRYINPWKPMSEGEIMNKVKDNSLFGLVECDIHVPDDLKEKFKEMQPIFKNTMVSRDDIGEHMKEYAKNHNLMPKPRRMLVGSYFGEKILIATPLLQWYIEHGLVITKIYQVIEFERKTCFKEFGESVSSARRDGDSDPAKAIVADTMKLLGNSGYGKTVTNKEVHRNTKYVKSDEAASKMINDHLFRRLNPLSESIYEIEMNKNKIKFDLPLQIGFFVYQYAKLRMLEFYYDFIDFYIDRRNFEYIEMDTDSAYLALSTKSLEDAVRPSLRKHFFENWNRWLPAEACSDHKLEFIENKMSSKEWITVHDCCKERKAFDKRTPGLFKIEWQGKGMVALNSKTYFCYSDESHKVSCKGLSKNLNHFRKDEFMNVLKTKQAGKGENRGFQLKENQIFTYHQTRAGLSYLYPKRVVQEDGVSTKPIDV